MRRITLVLAILISATALMTGTANATTPDVCTVQVIDQPAHDTTIIDQPAQPATPGSWWNWSPNKDTGPFDGPPTFPNDDRGAWQGPHTDGGPDGVGTYQAGDGHGSWFHREPGTPAIPEVTHTETVPATYKTVVVPCEEEPPTVVGDTDMYWLVPAGGSEQAPFAGGPQPALTGVPAATCEPQLIQHDWYHWDNADEKAGVEALDDDGVLSEGEDYPYVTDWEFITVDGDPDLCEQPPVDVCPDVPGDQPEGTDCAPVVPPSPRPPFDKPDKPTFTTKVVEVDRPLPDTGGAPVWWLVAGVGMVVAAGVTLRARRS